ncbi:MAG: killer suppression protein [Magnetococcales bacterium]|nr:killer suppression protein [Magnetococcales bacterium]
MIISYRPEKLAKIFNELNLLKKIYGERQARKIAVRLVSLHSAVNLKEFWPAESLPERCHELKGARKGEFSMDLDHPFRLIFQPSHKPIPQLPQGGTDWSQITAITILRVEDTHGHG